jgi:hypothetical protein
VKPQVLQQAHYHLNHDTAEQSSSQQSIDSYIYQSRPVELNTRKYRDYSYSALLNSFMLRCRFWCSERALRRAAAWARVGEEMAKAWERVEKCAASTIQDGERDEVNPCVERTQL